MPIYVSQCHVSQTGCQKQKPRVSQINCDPVRWVRVSPESRKGTPSSPASATEGALLLWRAAACDGRSDAGQSGADGYMDVVRLPDLPRTADGGGSSALAAATEGRAGGRAGAAALLRERDVRAFELRRKVLKPPVCICFFIVCERRSSCACAASRSS